MPKVFVKWSGKKLEVQANTDMEPLVLKSQLFELTGVVPERQKVMFKGKTIKDDSWEGIALHDDDILMMMGSTGSIPVAPAAAAGESSSSGTGIDGSDNAAVRLPVGLKNLGNTCYMNATFQAFLAIPELVKGVEDWTSAGSAKAGNETFRAFTGAMSTLFRDMKSSDRQFFIPLLPLKLLHSMYPHFAIEQQGGGFQQQDANECFTELLREFASVAEYDVGAEGDVKKIPVRRFIEGEYEVKLKNLEDENEPEQTTKETFLQLSCFLSQEIRYLQSGIKSKLSDEIEKNSPSLNRNCRYQKEARISRLPAHVSVQMVRFEFKQIGQVNAKILKDVKFPMILDLFDCCTPELQKKLLPQRDQFKIYDDKKVEAARQAKLADIVVTEPKKVDEKFAPSSFEDDPGSCNSGYYQLNAIITHKGRSSDSGHYVAWVRLKDNSWAMCDDEDVYPVTEEHIQKLSGGGDFHIAYVLLYGPRLLPIMN